MLRVPLILLFAVPVVAADPPAGTRRALLVGVTAYPNLDKRFTLTGPGNDVVLARDVLTKHFGFKDSDVVTLSEAAGTADPAKLPTRANIEREFKRLAAEAKPGDKVFVAMGGHGSQQPENDRPGAEPEPDGLDETFLPRDVAAWDDKVGTVPNAILDDDLGAWVRAVRDKGASVFLVMDSCHSGTMTRGGGGDQLRQVEGPGGLGIPPAAEMKAKRAAIDREAAKPGERTRGGPAPEAPPLKLTGQGGLVALYAAQPSEPTAECDLPPKDPSAKRYGLLSFALASALTKGVESSSKPLTYRELAQRVHQQYAAWGRTFPTPMIEGGDRDREVFGDTAWPGRPSYTLAKTPDGWKVNAGSVHGVTRDSILSVGKGDAVVGYVKVTGVRPTECDVEPTAHESIPAKDDLPPGGACKIAVLDYGDQKLRVAVDPLDDRKKDPQPIPADAKASLEAAVREIAAPGSLVEFATDPKAADWLVRRRPDGKVLLVPASGTVAGSATDTDPAFGPVPADAKLGGWLKDALIRISRADNLKAIAARDEPSDGGPQIGLEFTIGKTPAVWPSPDLTIYDKDKVRMTLTNPGRVAVDVTVLYLDSSYGVACLFPDKSKNEDNRLRPGEKVPLGFDASAATTGQENLLVLAVKADGPAVDFAGLEQPSLDRFRDVSPATRGKASALKGLLQTAAYGDGATRGLARATDDEAGHVMKLVTWQLKPGKRPPAGK